jgi:hypothetical protein
VLGHFQIATSGPRVKIIVHPSYCRTINACRGLEVPAGKLGISGFLEIAFISTEEEIVRKTV